MLFYFLKGILRDFRIDPLVSQAQHPAFVSLCQEFFLFTVPPPRFPPRFTSIPFAYDKEYSPFHFITPYSS